MLAESYAKALYQVIESGMSAPKAFSGLDAVLERRGHQKLKVTILQALSRYAEQKAVSNAPIVTVANEASLQKLAKEIAHAEKELEAIGEPVVVTDNRQIGGFSLQYDGRIVDRSYKGKLIELYRSITRSVS